MKISSCADHVAKSGNGRERARASTAAVARTHRAMYYAVRLPQRDMQKQWNNGRRQVVL
ncbi:hypothetical protein [Burkholderia multivorans]|uniref:hypothetical protein n=1 Tax=Burkholderia multivorans TaxID=87883 RepID=UPI001C23FB40|nr:hypothetical protein [Burkholderia multivorans]MBU9487231.1 hypothetical protein [Burkholderia multivorans]